MLSDGDSMSLESVVKKIEAAYGRKVELRKDVVVRKTINKWDLVSYYYLNLYFLCKELGCLPRTGGLEDQDYLVLHFFSFISGTVAELTRPKKLWTPDG